MSAWKRWQDWASVVAGVVLFLTPFVFGPTPMAAATWTAVVGGVLLVLAGVWNLARPSGRTGQWVQGVIGLLLILSPWVLGFASVAAMAYSAWIIGIISVVLAGSVLYGAGSDRPAMVRQP